MQQALKQSPIIAGLQILDRGSRFLRFSAFVYQKKEMNSFELHPRVAGKRPHTHALMARMAPPHGYALCIGGATPSSKASVPCVLNTANWVSFSATRRKPIVPWMSARRVS